MAKRFYRLDSSTFAQLLASEETMSVLGNIIAKAVGPIIAKEVAAVAEKIARNQGDAKLARRSDDTAEAPNVDYRKQPRVKYAFVHRRSGPPPMPPTMAQVYEAFAAVKESVLGYNELLQLPGVADMNPTTVRWAVQALRQRGLIETIDIE